MCWSLNVSLGSYALVCAGSGILLRRGWGTDKWFALWLFYVGQIQLLEAFLWLDPDFGPLHQTANKLLLAVIAGEPLAGALIALYCTPAKQRSRLQWGLAQFAAAGAAAMWAVASRGNDWCAHPCGAEGGNHMVWPWTRMDNELHATVFLALICVPFATMRPRLHGAAGAGYTAAIFAVAYIFFHSAATFESMWCWLAVTGYCVPFLLNRRAA